MQYSVGTFKLMDAKALSQNTTNYTDSISFERNVGTIGSTGVLLTSSAGSITVTQQCSLDNSTWYDAVDSANSAVGAVATTMSVGTRYIKYTPAIAKFIRFKVVENNSAATTVTLTLISQELY